jgi:acetylornithine deacetylase/succinyl-diaminopimelate desuccinylase-like protein
MIEKAGIHDCLKSLVKIPSVRGSETKEPGVVKDVRDAIIGLFKQANIPEDEITAITIKYPDDNHETTPLVYADHSGPPGAPTVLLYAHYDVQPAGKKEWKKIPDLAPAVADSRPWL